MKGECLCGDVEFEIKGDLPNLYQCHCSLCRKVTGSSAATYLASGFARERASGLWCPRALSLAAVALLGMAIIMFAPRSA
jgi:hypothetical protein